MESTQETETVTDGSFIWRLLRQSPEICFGPANCYSIIHFPRRELHHEQSTQAAQSDQVWGVQQGLNTEQNHECTVHITHSPGWPLKPHQADSSVRCKDVQRHLLKSQCRLITSA